jgi:Tannase and feruloyl esterase
MGRDCKKIWCNGGLMRHVISLLLLTGTLGCVHEPPVASTSVAGNNAKNDTLTKKTDCTSLLNFKLPNTSITSVVLTQEEPAQGAVAAIPAHCVLTGEIGARTGVNGVRYSTGFELRLPLSWNGRFQFMGGGGTDGNVRAALGYSQNGMRPALSEGYAVVSSDFGHQAKDPRDASFGLDMQARIDWGYNSIALVTERAKSIIKSFYGSAPRYSYYAGCSGGGRQAMMAALRFANDFDGVLASSPIFEQHLAQTGSMQILQEFTAIAPKNTDGKPILSKSFSDADLALIQRDVLDRCDALDGIADGIIEKPAACKYDPARLTCNAEKTASCLSRPQVNALTRVLDGPRNARSQLLYPGYALDAGVVTWRGAMFGSSETATPNAARATNTSVKYVFMTPPQPNFDYLKFNFDTDPALLLASANYTATNSTDYTAFKNRGGKAIITQGTGDGLLNANGVRNWYERLSAANGGVSSTQTFARYFQVPGMGHCSGGPSLDQFDAFSALVNWVENGQAPNQILASARASVATSGRVAFPGRTRPLCAYPKTPRYLGAGSVDQAENFRCE